MNTNLGPEKTERWSLVLGSTLGMAVGTAPAVLYSFSIFLKPLSEDLHADRATVSLAPSLAIALYGLATMLAGRVFDKFGIRRVLLPSIALTAALFMCLGLFASSVWAVIGFYVAVTVATTGYSALPYAKVLVAAFERRRGLALGLAMAGTGVGTAIVPAINQMVLDDYGWRTAYAVLGLIIFCVAFPAAYLTMPDKVETVVSERGALSGVSAREAVRGGVFWQIALTIFILAIATTGIFAHVSALLTDRGIDKVVAATAISAGGIAIIVGRVLTGILLDRYHARYVFLAFFVAAAVGVAMIVFSSMPMAAWFGVALIGLALGAEVDLMAYVCSRYFGLREFGAIYGYLLATFIGGGALGPFVMGASYSRTGSYSTALMAFLALLIVGAVLAIRLGVYRFGASHRHEAGDDLVTSATTT